MGRNFDDVNDSWRARTRIECLPDDLSCGTRMPTDWGWRGPRDVPKLEKALSHTSRDQPPPTSGTFPPLPTLLSPPPNAYPF